MHLVHCIHYYPCNLLAHIWKDPCHVDRAARIKLTQKPETDCDRDCKHCKCGGIGKMRDKITPRRS
jgi:hypothetical protein